MENQKQQYENIMKANMEELKQEREAMKSNSDQTGAMIKMMSDLIMSRDQQVADLQKTVLELASKPPVVSNTSGGLFETFANMADKGTGLYYCEVSYSVSDK